MTSRRYAAYPTATLYELGTAPDKEPPERLKARKQLLWGDELKVIGASKDGAFLEVLARNVHGWIKLGETQEQRLLEVVFVDIGQGDGALLVTPDNKRYLVDAGKGDNMLRFLRWRFGRRRQRAASSSLPNWSRAWTNSGVYARPMATWVKRLIRRC